MEKLYKLLGLEESSSEGALVESVKTLQANIEDKDKIIKGLTNQIKNYEEQISSISSGVAEARVKDLVRKVQSETGYHVGGDYVKTLNKKAAQHLYAGEGEQSSIWEDMKAYCIAYGTKLDMSKEIESLSGTRSKEGMSKEDKRYARAEELISNNKAKDWDEAMKIVLEEEEELKNKNK